MKRVVCAGSRRIEYILIQTARSNILMQALPEGQTRVYAPKHMRLREIDETIRKNAEKIVQMHESLDRKLDEDRANKPVSDGSRISVEGKPLTLHLHAGGAQDTGRA